MTPGRARLVLALAWAVAACSGGPDSPGDTSHAGHPEAHPEAAASGRAAPSSGVPGMASVTVPPHRRQAIGVRTEAIERRALAATIRTVGLVVADERRVRKVQTKIAGWVERLFVDFTGEHVDRGQPILSIYSPDLVATQREYLLALEATRQAGGGTDRRAQEARRGLPESARSRLLLWDLTPEQIAALERSGEPQRTVSLHSPIGGYVTLKPVYAGMYVTPEMELYTITDLDRVWVWADVYEDEIGLVSVGQTAALRMASSPGRPRTAVVSYVNPTLEPATRTLRVRLDVDNAEGTLKPGMYATVEIEAPLGDALALPEDALIDTGERKIVFVAAGDDRFQPRAVEIGRKAGAFYEVLAGLDAGDQVVVSAQFLLDSESRLRAAAGGPSHGGH